MTTRLSVALALAATMVATALLVVAGSAAAATTWNVYCPGGDLQNTIDNLANPGDTIVIYGTCYGNFVTNFKVLTLQGGSSGATLNGKGAGSTLEIEGLSDVTIRNLSITNGNGSLGGGIKLGSSSLTMVNATVKGNRADFGGGIYAINSSLDLTGVTVTRNTAAFEGGGLDLESSDLTAVASAISLNKTTQFATIGGGGGIRMQGANVQLTGTRVTANSSARFGGGIADYGGQQANCSPPVGQVPACLKGTASGRSVANRTLSDGLPPGLMLVSSSIDHNIASLDGGGIYNASSEGDSPITLQGSTVSFNSAQGDDGGGIANYGECDNIASVLATGSTFQGNQARNGDGGAIYNATGTGCGSASAALVTIAQSGVSNAPNSLNQNQAKHGGGIANEQDNGLASLAIQAGAQITGNKASVTGGGIWNNCGSLLKTGGNVLLNTPNNIVNTCIQ